jgi:hypothetical protein
MECVETVSDLNAVERWTGREHDLSRRKGSKTLY